MPFDVETLATRAGLTVETVERLSSLDLIPRLEALEDNDIPVFSWNARASRCDSSQTWSQPEA